MIDIIILVLGISTAFFGCTNIMGLGECPTIQNIINNNDEEEKTEITNLYGFPIPTAIINANMGDIKQAPLPVVEWYEGWSYMGTRIPDGKEGLPDRSYQLENLLKLKYDLDTVDRLMSEFKKGDSTIKFNDNTYITFASSSDGARMIFIGYTEKQPD